MHWQIYLFDYKAVSSSALSLNAGLLKLSSVIEIAPSHFSQIMVGWLDLLMLKQESNISGTDQRTWPVHSIPLWWQHYVQWLWCSSGCAVSAHSWPYAPQPQRLHQNKQHLPRHKSLPSITNLPPQLLLCPSYLTQALFLFFLVLFLTSQIAFHPFTHPFCAFYL